jgi:hypothetical protein
MTDELREVPCLTCPHRRVPQVPEPSCISQPNRQRFRWREEWRNRLREREGEEDEAAGGGAPFVREPWFYAWCHLKTLRESNAGSDDDVREFVLADRNQQKQVGGRIVVIDCEDHPRHAGK